MNTQRRAELYLLIVTAIWGSTFVVGKALLEENSPLFYTGVRFLFSALVLVLIFRKRLLTIPSSTAWKGGVLGLLLFGGFTVQTVGLQYTTSSKSAFFTGLLVVLTPVVYVASQHILRLRRKALRVGNILGVAAAALGLYLLTASAGSEFNSGDALTLICAFLFALYIVYLDSASSEPDKLQLTYVQFIFCGTLGIISALLLEHIRVSMSAVSLGSFLYLAIVATIIAMWVQNRYQGETSPTRAAVIFSLEPVTAAVFGYFIRGEVLGTVGIIGGCTVLLGVLVSEVSDEIPLLKISLTREQE